MWYVTVSCFFLCVILLKKIKKNSTSMFPKTFIFQATIKGKKPKQYQTAENIEFAWVFSLHFHICTVVKEQDMYTEF